MHTKWYTYLHIVLFMHVPENNIDSYQNLIGLILNCKKIEAQNKRLLEIRNKSLAEQKRVLRDQRKAMLKEKKEKSEVEALLSAVKVHCTSIYKEK